MSDLVTKLVERDDRFAPLVARHGPLLPRRDTVDFHALANNIVGQQLSGKAADTIWSRVISGVGCEGRLSPDHVLPHSVETLREFGLSRPKASYVRDLARRTSEGEIPFERFDSLPDEAIIEALLPVKGIGRWTVQMLLIFSLGRPDVWPVDDLGVQEGVRMLEGLPHRPRPREMHDFGERWAPVRSVAALYLWRMRDTKEHATALGC